MEFSAIILAAGKGTRMKSARSKLVHQAAGLAVIEHVVAATRAAGVRRITLVLGHGREEVEALFAGQSDITYALQEEQLGTGHAMLMAAPYFQDDDTVLVLAGDTPLLRPVTLIDFMAAYRQQGFGAAVLSTRLDDPTGYGRIVRDRKGQLQAIVEEKDADTDIKAIKEINSGMYCFNAGTAFAALRELGNDNAQGEYYLTDILAILREQGQPVQCICVDAKEDIYGINDRRQLAAAEKVLRRRKNDEVMLSGVTLMDPDTVYIDVGVNIGPDTVIYPQTMLQGATVIGSGCEIGPNTRIADSVLGDRVTVEQSRISQAKVGDDCNIGPFAYLRPETVLNSGVTVGDFVEIKKSIIGEHSKIPHLSYVGDAVIGKDVNVGAGTITCNYDGVNKHRTVLEDGAFIGSNTNLVAPVTIGCNAFTGAGSTITKDVPANALAVERAPQRIIEKWGRKKT
ncbi:MAG: bifunctional UDP-N-acetylglucosamine diphosphorylase/glucosamine-1-phosphate N-acetyltransferase GlmU [Syntrophomonadaceae bacterium]|nr:bifunctional UDP-N-acetylglucosamine diphosphorylase/glucosamine-1-phosphate N-acetyltransferase GlmU [Syntrophomonadaceae bacterium]